MCAGACGENRRAGPQGKRRKLRTAAARALHRRLELLGQAVPTASSVGVRSQSQVDERVGTRTQGTVLVRMRISELCSLQGEFTLFCKGAPEKLLERSVVFALGDRALN